MGDWNWGFLWGEMRDHGYDIPEEWAEFDNGWSEGIRSGHFSVYGVENEPATWTFPFPNYTGVTNIVANEHVTIKIEDSPFMPSLRDTLKK